MNEPELKLADSNSQTPQLHPSPTLLFNALRLRRLLNEYSFSYTFDNKFP